MKHFRRYQLSLFYVCTVTWWMGGSRKKQILEKKSYTRQVPSMIHSARPIVTPVANIVFRCFVFLDLKSGYVRTDNMCENNVRYWPSLWVGPSGSIKVPKYVIPGAAKIRMVLQYFQRSIILFLDYEKNICHFGYWIGYFIYFFRKISENLLRIVSLF